MTQLERLDYLIQYLLGELDYEVEMPDSTADKKRLLRSLMNVRMPKDVSAEFLKVQDAYLKEETAGKGITDADELQAIQGKLCLWQGDITRLRCGAIVNAANSRMLGCFVPCHACIDNVIHTYAGIQLRAECAHIMNGAEEPTGRARVTKAYNLPSDYVIHTVGPIVDGDLTERHCELLASCYRECLRAADAHNIKSIAFCCISTGVFRFPNERAAEIAVETVKAVLPSTGIERVIFNVFKDVDYEIYEQLLTEC